MSMSKLASIAPHERALASHYLVYRDAPVASATFTPDQLRNPQVAEWFRRAKALKPGAWTYADLGMSIDDFTALQDVPRPLPHELPALEARVVEEWCLRRTRNACAAFLDRKAPDVPAAQRLMQDVTEALSGRPVESVTHRDAVQALSAQWIKDIAAEVSMLPLPWPRLTEQIGGLPRRKVILIGGRSSEHKTTTARAMAEHCAREGYRPLFWTLEDSTPDVANRTIAADIPGIHQGDLVAGISPKHYGRGDNGRPTEHGLGRLCADLGQHAAAEWTERLRYHDEPNPTLARVESYIRAEAARGIDLFVGDFIQLIQPDKGDRVSDTWWRVVMARMSALAKELNIPIVWTSQIEKTGTKESEGRIPRAIEMPFGAQLRQGAFGIIMVGTVPDIPGKLCMVVDKWKSAARNKSPEDAKGKLVFKLDPAHDRIIDDTPPPKESK